MNGRILKREYIKGQSNTKAELEFVFLNPVLDLADGVALQSYSCPESDVVVADLAGELPPLFFFLPFFLRYSFNPRLDAVFMDVLVSSLAIAW